MAQIDNYFDLNQKQEHELRRNMNEDLNHLRRERFDKMAKTLRQIEQQTKTPESNKLMSSAYVDLQSEYWQSHKYFKPSTHKFISSLSPSQLSSFEKKVRKEISESREALAKHPDSLNQDLISSYQDGLEFWIGDLSPAQKELLTRFTKEHPFPWQEKIKNSETLLDQFTSMQGDSAKMKSFSEKFVAENKSLRIPEYTQALASYDKEFQTFLDMIWTTLDQKQRSHLRENLLGRASKLEELARRENNL